MDSRIIKNKANKMFQILQPYCTAIYLGGSITQSYINNPHDVDFICFADNEINRMKMTFLLRRYISKHQEEFSTEEDWIQTRHREYEEHAYGSYVHKDMQLLCGKEVEFKFDILGKDRAEYIKILKNAKFNNKKRLYQLYRGYLIVKKNSYDLTNDEIEKLNLLHDNIADDNLKNEVLSLINGLEV